MINRWIGVGRLVKDPELRYSQSGVAVARFTLAVNRTFKGNDGEKQADFINIVVWRKQAENTANFLKKGSLAGIEGRIQTGSYEGTNGRVYTTEVVADSVQFLEPKNTQDSSNGQSNTNTQPQQQSAPQGQYGTNNQQQTQVNDDPFSQANGQIQVDDSDLPF
ncbi:single-stranded DNA-binding protein [Viridibacillus sp. NPDC096237]|uniref:single-stranded DNA-binding protein n=1 Tax=Viridibacillus sp. NPDC096237 TaxID=3390721 RepID=UPI003CFE7070